mmetsp:Transcript_6730/g.11295  ORF Transcript_6730/g.11295 Transcript_6730/m.11295 type:complete len:83 (-) Transcript_6730:331-579(-)
MVVLGVEKGLKMNDSNDYRFTCKEASLFFNSVQFVFDLEFNSTDQININKDQKILFYAEFSKFFAGKEIIQHELLVKDQLIF